jgi:hypothetical protein
MFDWLKRLFKRKPKATEAARIDTPLYEGNIEETLKSHTTITKYCVVCGMEKEHKIIVEDTPTRYERLYQCTTCGHMKKPEPWILQTSTKPFTGDVSNFFKGKGSKTTLKSYRKTVKNRVQPEEE